MRQVICTSTSRKIRSRPRDFGRLRCLVHDLLRPCTRATGVRLKAKGCDLNPDLEAFATCLQIIRRFILVRHLGSLPFNLITERHETPLGVPLVGLLGFRMYALLNGPFEIVAKNIFSKLWRFVRLRHENMAVDHGGRAHLPQPS